VFLVNLSTPVLAVGMQRTNSHSRCSVDTKANFFPCCCGIALLNGKH
jgi:hypothetical protein